MTRKRKYTPFARWADDSDLWMDVRDTGIEMIVLMVDGFCFKIEKGKKGRTYVKVKAVLEWHKKEWSQWKRPNSDLAVAALEKVMSSDATGDIEFQD